jgi:hypothetical protein
MTKVLRWHVSRMYEAEDSKQISTRKAEYIITPESAKGIPQEFKTDPQNMAKLTRDNLEWWEADEDQQIEGTTTYGLMLDAVTAENVFGISERSGINSDKRKIVEGMVFLQFVQSESALEDEWEGLKRQPGLPDVSSLIKLENSRWLDFTQQARQMSAAIYRKVLGEKVEDKDAS